MLVRKTGTCSTGEQRADRPRRGVDKRGPKSDVAYVREVLGDMASASNLLVITTRPPAWRVPAESKIRGVAKSDIEEATRWIGGLDRIHRSRGSSAVTTFRRPRLPRRARRAPGGSVRLDRLDFSLNDAIESGW